MTTWSWAYIRWTSGFGLKNRVWQYPIPTSSDSITFQWLKNLHVAMPPKPQSHFFWCEAKRSLQNFFHDFLQLVQTNWGSTARAIIHWALETPSCALWIQRVNPLSHHPSRSRWFWRIPAILAPPVGTYKTHLYHLLGQVAPILGSWWHMFILGHLSMNWSLIWFRGHIKPEDYRLPLKIASKHRLPQTQFPNRSPKS
jgi:hypothetical protein